jgi:hypothetical protein
MTTTNAPASARYVLALELLRAVHGVAGIEGLACALDQALPNLRDLAFAELDAQAAAAINPTTTN